MQIAARQGNLLGRHQVYALGWTRSELRAELAAQRWKAVGAEALQVGDPDDRTPYWWAVLEVGPSAVVDGISALLLAGLRTVASDRIHIAVPPRAWHRRPSGVRVHETRRLREEDVLRNGIPRTRPATAAVHAALWARSDSEASLIVVAAVQQRRVRVADLAAAVERVQRHPRRALLHGLLSDVSDGVESIDERNFARACRRRGFPKPDRQVVVNLPSGRVRYDSVWAEYDLTVEIHGVQHLDAALAMRDTLKQNAAVLAGKVTLQIPNFAFRTNEDPFLDQMEAVFRAGGWEPARRQRRRAS